MCPQVLIASFMWYKWPMHNDVENSLTHTGDFNRDLIRRFTNQPERVSPAIQKKVEALKDGPMLLYALTDLDASLRLSPCWVILTKEFLIFADPNGMTFQVLERSRVHRVHETTGLSCHQLILTEGPDTPPLAELFYTQRQQRAMEGIKALLDSRLSSSAIASHGYPDDFYADAVAGPIREAQAAVSGNNMAVIWRLLGYLKPYKRQLIIGAIAAIILTIVSLVPPYLTGFIIDYLSKPSEVGDDSARILWGSIALLATVFTVRSLCLWIRLRTMSRLGEYVAHDLRRDLYDHLQSLSMRFFSRKQTGSIISRVSSDTDRLWDFIAFGIIEVSMSILMLIGLGSVLVYMDWKLGLLMVVPVPFYFWAFYRHSKKISRIFLRAWRKWSHLTALVSGTIPGIRVVKAFNQEAREIKRFGERNRDSMNVFNDVHVVWTNFWPRLMLSFHAMTVAVWVFALPRVLGNGSPTLSPGTFVAFLFYVMMFMHPLEVIGQITRMMNRAVSSAYRVFEILDTQPQIREQGDAVPVEHLDGGITFTGVGFSYDGVRRVLHDINFAVKPGEMIGLVGPSGAGKSTLINLIARFYDVSEGSIKIDGYDIRNLDLGTYRRKVGIVLQEPYLFHGTILDNIGYGLDDPSPAAIIEAARAANAHEFICKLPEGYETAVGERGQTLSGGERQRISIARAILHNPQILILDEATSNVDTETERNIQEALQRLVQGRTVIAIAHRLSTLKRADRLLVLKDGRLVESGTHEELLQMEDGVFKHLYELQHQLHEQFAV